METFVEKTLQLLAQERDAETEESQSWITSQLEYPDKLQSKGVCLTKLHVSSQYIGLYGRSVIAFELSGRRPLPSTAISAGDIVGVFAHGRPVCERGLSGIVVRKDNVSLAVAFDQLDDSVDLTTYDGILMVVKLCNDVTYRRMKRSLEELRSRSHQHLVRVLFGEDVCLPPDPKFTTVLSNPGDLEKFPFLNAKLDESQRHAVLFALCRPDVAIIHGPPGTGKTTTLVELILQSVNLGQKVLACAPSNIAVDNIVERLAEARAKVVRVGHPARLSESIQGLSLDALLHKIDSAEVILDVRKDIKSALNSLHRSRGPSEKAKWRSELKVLKKELQNREQKAIKELLRSADVILATTNGASRDGPLKYLPDGHFNLTVIDECAQAVEASCWIPLLHSTKCVIAGDHKQLPPTILSTEAAQKGLALSLMERLIQLHNDDITAMLTVQYRMHERIMSPSSKVFYGDMLVAHSSVVGHTLCDVEGVSRTQLTSAPLLFIETSGCNMLELETLDEQSKGNEGEADLVVHHLKALVSAGVTPSQIAVIAPYSLQVELIRKRLESSDSLMSAIEVHTVDGFQGREKEAVVISFTRSNSKGECGFLNENRRTNVAVTRARRHLTLIGDSGTVAHEPFIKQMIDYCHEFGEVWTAHEYLNDPAFDSVSCYEPKSVSKPKIKKGTTSKDKNDRKETKKSKIQHIKVETNQTVHKKITEVTGDDQSLMSSLEGELMEFLDGPENCLKFSTTLTSNERRLVHEMCEKLDLLHMSRGEGSQRYIEVRKRCLNLKDESKDTSCTEQCEASAPGPPIEIVDDTLNDKNGLLSLKSSQPQISINTKPSVSTSTKPSKKKPPKSKKHPNPISSDDLDSLLSEVTLMDSVCSQSKCKKSINLISVKCSFCSKRFCMEHSLPEVHGCGDEVRRNARKRSVPKPSSRPSSDRARLQKKLHDKIDKMSSKTGKAHKK